MYNNVEGLPETMIQNWTAKKKELAKNRKFYAFIYLLSFLTIGLESAALGPTMKLLAVSTDSTLAAVTVFVTIKSFGYMTGSFIGAKFFDRFRGHQVLILSIATMTAIMLFIPFAGSFIAAVIPMFLLGFAEGITDIGGNLMIIWVFQDNLAPYMNALHFMFGFGSLLAPMITASFLSFENSLLLTYWVIALLYLPSMIGLSLLPSPKRIESTTLKEEKNRQTRLIILFSLIFFTYVGVEITFGNWIFTYASESRLATDLQAAFLNSTFWGSFTAGRLIGIFLSKKVKPKTMLLINFTGTVFCLLLLVLFRGSVTILWTASMLLGLFLATSYPTLMVFAGSLFTITGSITRWFMAGSGLGVLLIPFVMTYLFDKLGIRVVPIVLFIVSLVGLMNLMVMLFFADKTIQKTVKN
jgi:FHS family Na+ dependent glucose MFS transporter 1